VKLSTNTHHVSGHCYKGFQDERSKVKAMFNNCLPTLPIICIRTC